MEEEGGGGALVGEAPLNLFNDHITKRELRNKSLAVSFDEKDLKDFVGGFHKRKKKRRKDAERKHAEADRRKRLEIRKQRRKEKEYALYGDNPPEKDGEVNDEGLGQNGEDSENNDENELNPSVSGTTTYENGDVMVTVTTSVFKDEEEERPTRKSVPEAPFLIGGTRKKQNIPVKPVIKKKPVKKVRKGSSRPKLQSKRERRKGNKRS